MCSERSIRRPFLFKVQRESNGQFRQAATDKAWGDWGLVEWTGLIAVPPPQKKISRCAGFTSLPKGFMPSRPSGHLALGPPPF